MSKTLLVYIANKQAGILTQGESGQLSFRYAENYAGVPLSVSMPVSARPYLDKQVKPFICGLLPDDPVTRRNIGQQFGISGSNPFTLIEAIGMDCPGAIQICSAERATEVESQLENLETVTKEQIAVRLRRGRESVNANWVASNEHWSLGGQQSKFALRKEGNKWYSCAGAAATTHIFKPGISALHLQALNEFLCLKLAAECGIPAAQVDYELFDGEPAIIVTRYDRARDAQDRVVRLHQEDFCQALGVLPENKYAEYGGPSSNDCIALLKQTGPAAKQNIQTFIKMLLFNYLIAAPDAHAKNYSLLLGRDASYIAPLYDVASIAPYDFRLENAKVAMSIGGENRVCKVSANNISKFVKTNNLCELGLTEKRVIEFALDLAERIPRQLQNVIKDFGFANEDEAFKQKFLETIALICKKSADSLIPA